MSLFYIFIQEKAFKLKTHRIECGSAVIKAELQGLIPFYQICNLKLDLKKKIQLINSVVSTLASQ